MRLGMNIDHVATLRNARGGHEPSPVEAAAAAVRGGADQITVHLREDRRHIVDRDVEQLKECLQVDLNLEMAATEEMVQIALKLKPDQVTLVPEKREERTTEGGLNLSLCDSLKKTIDVLQGADIPVVLFVEPEESAMVASAELGVAGVELHTGGYANSTDETSGEAVRGIRQAAIKGVELGLLMHAGHGLNYRNTPAIAGIREIRELNIGHAIVSRAVFHGLERAVADMKALMQRSQA